MTDRRDHDSRVKAAARGVTALLLVGLVLWATPAARAQDDLPPLPVDPTPLADLLTAQEKALLDADRNPKKVVETYVKIAEGRLDAALVATKGNDAARAERELDVFQKAMAECVKLAAGLTDGKRAAAKKVEQALDKQLRTLESVERLFPTERVQFAEAAIKRAKRFRVQMLNIAIASGDVLNDPESGKPPTTQNRLTAPPAFDVPHDDGLARQAAGRDLARRPAGLRAVAWHRPAAGQMAGDYLTEEEDDYVRKAQSPDDRIKVFMKIADRRLAALNPSPAPAPTDAKAQKKAEEKAAEEKKDWGELPKLTRADLLRHYARAIEEAIAKLEDSYERNPKSKALAKALELLRDATDRHLQTLRALTVSDKDEREADALRRAIEQAEIANEGARKGVKAKSA